jgi:hypothetical protein
MYGKAGLLLAMAAAAMAGDNHYDNGSIIGLKDKPPLTEKEKEEIKRKQSLSKGLKEFIINGQKIYALNEKNAIKKYNKNLNFTP